MNLDSFTGPGSTPSRRRFWDKVTACVTASQKVAGRNVTIAEHHAAGTLINVVGGRGRSGGACCVDDVCSIQTAADCAAAGGIYQGDGTDCDPNPCGGIVGACCNSGFCSVISESDCISGGGYYFGDGSDCDPDPCADIGCCLTAPRNCNTILSTDCMGTFVSPGTFCWPEGDGSEFNTVSCCLDGDNTCISGDGLDYFCCTPPFTCCPGTESGGVCCSEDQTCCGDFGCCDAGQTCTEEGCI